MTTERRDFKRSDSRPQRFAKPASFNKPQSLKKPSGYFQRPTKAKSDFVKNPVVYIGNLNYKKDEFGIMNMFKPFGYVEKVNLIKDEKTETSKGIAFVEMQTKKAANEAVAELNGKVIDGRTVKVSIAKEREAISPNKAPKVAKTASMSKNEEKAIIKKGKVRRTGLDLLFQAKSK
jgi:RNA recognition motif-containing protein